MQMQAGLHQKFNFLQKINMVQARLVVLLLNYENGESRFKRKKKTLQVF